MTEKRDCDFQNIKGQKTTQHMQSMLKCLHQHTWNGDVLLGLLFGAYGGHETC